MTHDDLSKLLLSHAKKRLGDDTRLSLRHLQTPFEDLGIDSLHLTEITVSMLAELDLYIPMAQLARTTSPEEFLRVLGAEIAAYEG